MPQLDFSTFAPQLVWLAIVFIGLYLLMARIALPRVATVIEARKDRIASDLDQAEALRKQTDEAIAAYENALAEARARAHAIAQETRDQLNAETERHRAELEERLARQTADAEARIAAMKETALGNVRTVAADAAGAVVAHILGEDAADAEIAQAVDAELAAK